MSININSEASCRRAYLNYHCQGNSMGITAEEMGEITQAWKDKLTSWQKCASNDENEYEFDDSEFENSKTKGREQAEKDTGHDGSKGGMITRGVVDGVAGAAAGVLTTGVLNGALQGTASSIGTGLSKVCGETVAKGATSKGAGAKASWIIGAPLALATGTAYMAKKPNKTEKEACDALQNTMTESQGALADQQSEMENMAGELVDLSDEANDYNEEANDNIEDQKTEYDSYMETYLELKEKAESGEPLTQEEKDLFEEVVGYLTETGELITETQEDTTDTVQDIYDDMETYQEGYDYAAETMGEVEGITDFAEGFDSATQTMCYVEAGAQTLNAASGAKAAFDAGKFAASGGIFTAWAWGFAAMGAAGGVMSGIGATQQFSWAGEVGTEIGMRKDTQDLNTATHDMYDDEIDNYDGLMTGVEDLELEIPDDIEPPEDTELPGQNSPVPEKTPEALDPTKNEKKPKEEEDKK